MTENRDIKLKIKQKLLNPHWINCHWIMDDDDILGLTYWCSVCGYEVKEKTRYCPDCGMRMKEN